MIYIVMCATQIIIEHGHIISANGDEFYHIDSVWTSERKANKRCNELNSAKKEKWREEYGYGIFNVESEYISK